MEFAIQLNGEEQGHWVLAVDPVGNQFLTTNDDNQFRWIKMSECRLLKVKTPEMPQPVIMVQPKQPLGVPGLSMGLK